jgi:chloramphenicol O-acetyltransferase type A
MLLMSDHRVRILNLDEWARKPHFEFYQTFEEPYFGVCVEVECTELYLKAKESGISFFLCYLHKFMLALNELTPFRYRIDPDGNILEYEQVDASATIDKPNGTFGFSLIRFDRNYEIFEQYARAEIDRVRNSDGLLPERASNAVVHLSAMPWIRFTAVSHARKFNANDSVPKISFGKMTEHEGRRTMPLSIHVHHGLVDGRDVAALIDSFQDLLKQA